MKGIDSMTFGGNEDDIFDQFCLAMQFQNIACQGRISDKVLPDFDAISLDNNSRNLCVYGWIVQIPTQKEKQQYCSDIIFVEKRKQKNCSKNHSKNDISPLTSIELFWIVDSNFHASIDKQ